MGQAVKCQLQCRKTKGDRKRRKKHVYSEIPVLSTRNSVHAVQRNYNSSKRRHDDDVRSQTPCNAVRALRSSRPDTIHVQRRLSPFAQKSNNGNSLRHVRRRREGKKIKNSVCSRSGFCAERDRIEEKTRTKD